MKINWGTGIVIAFVLFISFILFFVLKAATNEDYAHELVQNDYYKAELSFQEELDKLKNTQALGTEIMVIKTTEGLEIRFPEAYAQKKIKGSISLYRPSNQSLDMDYPFVLSNSYTLLIPDQKLVGGRWDIKIDWKDSEKEFLFKKSLRY